MTTPELPGPGGPNPLDWDRYEAELDPTPQPVTPAGPSGAGPLDTDLTLAGERPVLVDSPLAQRPARPGLAGLRAARRRPILPPWLRSRAELAVLARWAAGFAAHTSAYHLTRTPTYAGRLIARAPRGAARLGGGWLRWLLDLEGEPVRQSTVRAQDAEAYLKLARQRDRRVRWRATVSLLLLAAVTVFAAVLVVASPPARWAALAGLVAALGVAGAPADRPLLERAVVVP